MDIAKFVAEIEDALNSPRGTIGAQDCLENLDGLDSMGILGVIATVHARYHVTLHAEQITSCRTVADLAAVVERAAKRP